MENRNIQREKFRSELVALGDEAIAKLKLCGHESPAQIRKTLKQHPKKLGFPGLRYP